MTRQDVIDIFQELVRFGSISASAMDGSKTLTCTVDGIDGESSSSDNEVFGVAPLSYKPASSTECLYLQLPDEKVVLGTRDRKFQIEVGNGEVVLRAMGSATSAYLKLSPDGTALLKGVTLTLDPTTRTNLAGTASTQPFVNGTSLVTALNSMITALNAYATSLASAGAAPVTGTAAGTAGTALATALTSVSTALTASLSAFIRGR